MSEKGLIDLGRLSTLLVLDRCIGCFTPFSGRTERAVKQAIEEHQMYKRRLIACLVEMKEKASA